MSCVSRKSDIAVKIESLNSKLNSNQFSFEKSTMEFYNIWKYLYYELIFLEKGNQFCLIGRIFEISYNSGNLIILTYRRGGYKKVKTFKYKANNLKVNLETFCNLYELKYENVQTYNTKSLKFVVEFKD